MKNLLIITAIFVSFTNIFAQEMPQFSPEIKRVAVFKNGYSLTYREAETTTNNGWAYTTKTPIGVLGTVWGYSATPNIKISQLVASETETEKSESVRLANLFQVLLANEGSRIRFQANVYNENKIYEGIYQIIGEANQAYIAVKTENGTIFIPYTSAYNLELLGKYESQTIIKTTQKERRLALKVDGAKDGQKINLGVAALEKGISWIPAYRIEAKGEPINEAKIELEGMLINDLTEMQNSDVYFVVGVPSFLFQNQVSPLSLGGVFGGISNNISQSLGNNFTSNAIMSTADSTAGTIPTSSVSPEEEQVASFSATQLFLYEGKQVSLKKGERMSMRLFSMTVPCSEVFEWTIDDTDSTATDSSRLNRIWYGLKLKNSTDKPWTTAPATAFYDWKPIGQNLLTFTPAGSENVLRITTATEVFGTHEVEETERLPKQIRERGKLQNYEIITNEGKIQLHNSRKTSAEMVLSRNVIGEVISVTNAGKITRDGTNLQALNPNSNIKWSVGIPSGDTEIKYVYKYFVRKQL